MAKGHTKYHKEEHKAGGPDEIPEASLLPQEPVPHHENHLMDGSDELMGIDPEQIGDGRVKKSEYYMLDGVNTASDLVTKDELEAVTQGLDWQESVISFYDPNDGLPSDPDDGDRYLSEATAEGWNADSIYEWENGDWIEIEPDTGFVTKVEDELKWYAYDGNEWSEWGTMVDHGSLMGLQDNDHDQYLLRDGSNYVTGQIQPESNLSYSLGVPGKMFNIVHTQAIRTFGGNSAEYGVYGSAGEGEAELWITNQVQDGGDIRLHAVNGDVTVDGGSGASLRLIKGADFEARGRVSIRDAELFPKIISQSSEPSLAAGELALWNDDETLWLMLNRGGTQYKVELS